MLESSPGFSASSEPVCAEPIVELQSLIAYAVWKEMYTEGDVSMMPSGSVAMLFEDGAISEMFVRVPLLEVAGLVAVTGQ